MRSREDLGAQLIPLRDLAPRSLVNLGLDLKGISTEILSGSQPTS